MARAAVRRPFPLTGPWRRRRDAVAGQPRPGGVRRPGQAARGVAGRAFGTGPCPSAADRRPKAVLAVLALACSRRPWPSSPRSAAAEAPYRTPAVAAALERAGRASPTAAAVGLGAAPRLALPGPGIGDAKLAFGPPAPPAAEPPPGPDERPTAAAAGPPAAGATPWLPCVRPVAAAPVAAVVAAPAGGAAPRLAVMLDDLGLDPTAARRAIDLPPGVTLDFLPYGRGLDGLAAAAVARGHDVFLHLPLEPVGDADPGPNALLTGLAPAEVARRLAWAFGRLPGAVGVNNHMGSRGTADPGLMLAVLAEVARRGLVFVDSRTTPFSVAPGIAGRLGLPFAARDVFLDNEPTAEAVQARLAEAERVARRHGGAIAIGHPYPATLAILAGWLPDAERRGVRLVTARSLTRVAGCGGVVAVAAAGGC